MKFLSNSGNARFPRFCIAIALPLLLQYHTATSQDLPDSAFEKVTLSFLKNEKTEKKIKDGQRQLFLLFNGYTVPDQKKFYYRYRDSLLGVATSDTNMKAENRKKFSDQFSKAGLSSQLPFSFALDELMNEGDTLISKQTISLYAAMKKENDELKDTKKSLVFIIAALAALAVLTFLLLLNNIRKAKLAAEEKDTISKQPVPLPDPKPDGDKKTKKLTEELKKIREEKKTIEEEKNKLQTEKNTLSKEKTDLTKKNEELSKNISELNTKHKHITGELEKTKTEKKSQEEAAARLQENFDKLSTIQKETEEQSKKMMDVVGKLETVLPAASFPDINNTLHSWFLLQEFIKGYKNKEFSVLSTPNFSKWVLQEDHTYPELDITNLAGNAPIINFLIDLRKRKFTKVAPDGSYLVLINQKITQQIFESLDAAE